MSATTDPRNTPKYQSDEVIAVPQKGATKILKGTLVMMKAGYAKPAATDTGCIALGRAKKTYDNTSGADGAKVVEAEPGIFRWVNGDSIAQADVGKTAWMVDNQTVSKASTGKSKAGLIVGVDALGVWVATFPYDLDLDATELASLIADLASTASGKGADMIGSDAAGYVATTVSDQLAEVKVIADAGMTVQKKTVTVAYNNAALAAANTNGAAATVNIGTALPANARIVGVDMRALTAYSGGGASAVEVDVGTSGDIDALVAAADVFAAAVDGGPADMPAGVRPNKTFVTIGAQLIATFTPDGGHKLSDLTAGSVIIDVLYAVSA